MTIHIFKARGPAAAPSKHCDIQQKSPLALLTEVRRVLQDVSSQDFSSGESLAVQLDRFSSAQSEISERPQRPHDLRAPGATHVDAPHAFSNETINRMRLGMGNVI